MGSRSKMFFTNVVGQNVGTNGTAAATTVATTMSTRTPTARHLPTRPNSLPKPYHMPWDVPGAMPREPQHQPPLPYAYNLVIPGLHQMILGYQFQLQKVTFPKPPRVIFVLGGPGSGKGTQCHKILEGGYGFRHLSAGDALREEQQRPNSTVGELIREYIKNGNIVPYEITTTLLQRKMLELMEKESVERFLIDGFPRQLDQAKAFEDYVTKPDFILFFHVPDNILTQRLLERGKTSGRIDDNLESIKKRLKTFHNQSMDVVSHYDGLGLVSKVDARGGVEEIWSKVEEALKDYR